MNVCKYKCSKKTNKHFSSEKVAVIVLKLRTLRLIIGIMPSMDTERIANRAGLDQIRLLLTCLLEAACSFFCTICPDLCVQKPVIVYELYLRLI